MHKVKVEKRIASMGIVEMELKHLEFKQLVLQPLWCIWELQHQWCRRKVWELIENLK